MKRRQQDEFWKDQAACIDQWEYFFAPGDAELAGWQEARARTICNACPVQVRCNEYAEQHGEKAGMWGGVNRERKRYGKRSELQS